MKILLSSLNSRYGDYEWALRELNGKTLEFNHISLDTIIRNKQIVKGVLQGKIYSRESMVKTFMSSCKVPDNISWKDFDIVWTRAPQSNIYFYDLLEFTVCPVQAVKILASYYGNNYKGIFNCTSVWYREFSDLLKQAVTLDIKVNASWSEKRMHDEHQRCTRLLMENELKSKEDSAVHPDAIDEPENGIHQLNCELEVFQEGQLMHHCIYTNYWSRIKSKNFLAFHFEKVEDDEDSDGCTLGIGRNNEDLPFDDQTGSPFYTQLFQRFDKQPTQGQRRRMDDFIRRHGAQIRKMLR